MAILLFPNHVFFPHLFQKVDDIVGLIFIVDLQKRCWLVGERFSGQKALQDRVY